MKRAVLTIAALFTLTVAIPSFAAETYSKKFCNSKHFDCLKVKSGYTWAGLFPDPEERDIVRRLNRVNTRLRPGQVIAIPKNLKSINVMDISPFPLRIDPPGEKTIIVKQKSLAWGAYNGEGDLVWWGPISSGLDRCDRSGKPCNTPSGAFRMVRKQSHRCISTKFPRPTGGAIMPYCMHFFGGFAMHGSLDVPGKRASHGCVRMYPEDARWLNEDFIELPRGYNNFKGTKVIVEPH